MSESKNAKQKGRARGGATYEEDEMFTVGEVFQTKTGEILEVLPFTATEFRLRMWHPETMEKTDNVICGSLEKLEDLKSSFQFKKIDPKTHIPIGLINQPTPAKET